MYQVAADGRQFLKTSTGWVQIRPAAAAAPAQQQVAANPQTSTPQPYQQQPASDPAWKQLSDAQDRANRSMLNFIRTCSGEEDYQGCVDRDRSLNGFDCYSSRDMYTSHCQKQMSDQAIAKTVQQQKADANVLEKQRQQRQAEARAQEQNYERNQAEQRYAENQRYEQRREEERRNH